MRRHGFVLVAAAALAAVGCSESPTGPSGVGLDFQIFAPATLPTKAVVDVETRIAGSERIEYPLLVTYEKANVGESFVVVGTQTIADARTRSVAMRVPLFEDPRIRVTVTEASSRAVSVSKTVQVDVLDFP